MSSEETKEKKDESECCNPENFKGMFEMMGKCFAGKSGFDCTSMMEVMKSQPCCGPEGEKETSGNDKESKGSCC